MFDSECMPVLTKCRRPIRRQTPAPSPAPRPCGRTSSCLASRVASDHQTATRQSDTAREKARRQRGEDLAQRFRALWVEQQTTPTPRMGGSQQPSLSSSIGHRQTSIKRRGRRSGTISQNTAGKGPAHLAPHDQLLLRVPRQLRLQELPHPGLRIRLARPLTRRHLASSLLGPPVDSWLAPLLHTF